MGPHSPSLSLYDGATPNSFTAGVMVNDREYSVTLNGDDPAFGGATTGAGANLASILYNQLNGLSIPGVSLSLVSGNTNGYAGDMAIDAIFSYGNSDDGIVWGMTADPGSGSDYGFIGQMSGAVPEPSTLIMLPMGLFGAAAIARRRAARRNRTTAVTTSVAPA